MPFFSVIMPTFNRAHMLSSAIESVIGQNEYDWELIIVDDGSKDGTKEVVTAYQKKDHRIKYVYQDNAERSIARNNGIAHAKGEWVCFLDSDDRYHNNHLSQFRNLISENLFEPGLYFSGLSFEQYDNTLDTYHENGLNNVDFVLMNMLATSRACVKREILDSEKFHPAIRIGEDTELWTRIAVKKPVFYHRYKTYIQSEHPGRSVNENATEAHLNTLKYIYNSLNSKISRHVRKQTLSNALFNIAKWNLLNDHLFKGNIYLFKSILKDPGNKQSKYKLNIIIQSLLLKKDKLRKLLV